MTMNCPRQHSTSVRSFRRRSFTLSFLPGALPKHRRSDRGARGSGLSGRPRAEHGRLPGRRPRAAALARGRGRRGQDRGGARARRLGWRAAGPPAVRPGQRPAACGLRRLQCRCRSHLRHAVYDWDYQRRLLAIRAAEAGAPARKLFGREFLLRRPLLEALEHDGPSVLLIDEIDRADDEFEAFLLEFLADFAITIPE